MQGFRRPVERWGGRGGRGGAPELSGGARGGRWRLLWRTAAMVAFGHGRGRARERREEPRESEREQGRAWRRPGHRGRREGRQAGREGGGVARWRARAGHTPLPLSRTKTTEEEAGWAACWLGRPATAGLHREEPQVSFPFFIYFCFSNFCHLF